MRDAIVRIITILKATGRTVVSFFSQLPWADMRDAVVRIVTGIPTVARAFFSGLTWKKIREGIARMDVAQRKRVFIIAGISLVVIMGIFVRALLTRPSYPIPRYIRYSYTAKNMTNRLVREAHFWTYVPVKRTPTQKCVTIKASHPYKLITDALGNQILSFTLKDIPPYGTEIISIEANLKLSDKPNHLSLKGKKRYLKAEEYCESDDPAIVQQAKQLRGKETQKTAENCFRWVANHVQYTGYVENPRGALYALEEKQGDCTEFMYLFVALSRANKIPTRGIGGYVVTDNAILRPTAYHNWAEFYDDGAWRIADPQRKIFMQNQSRYIAMHVIGDAPKNPIGKAYRFKYEGQGIKVRMNR